jgi:hypothetical protein
MTENRAREQILTLYCPFSNILIFYVNFDYSSYLNKIKVLKNKNIYLNYTM